MIVMEKLARYEYYFENVFLLDESDIVTRIYRLPERYSCCVRMLKISRFVTTNVPTISSSVYAAF